MRISSTGGVTLALHDLGGIGDPLLIAHATGFCGRAYEPLGAALARRFHVWAVDFRGHGDSTSPPDGDFSWTGMGDDVLAVADALGTRGIVGVGHSMGGAALLMATQAQAGLLRCAYLYEPIILPAEAPADGENPMAAAARRRYEVFATKAEALVRYATRPGLNVLRADALAAYVEHGLADVGDGTVRLKCRPEDEARTFEAEGKPTIDRLAGLAVPTTVAAGSRDDGQGPAAFAPRIAAAMPQATLRTYAHLGHFGPLQDPDTVAADVVHLTLLRRIVGDDPPT